MKEFCLAAFGFISSAFHRCWDAESVVFSPAVQSTLVRRYSCTAR
ncbi:hypothetical protein GCWU000246_00830 [Jonquetella anthropi E3_33 E1]|nr:hypothetical protein GCWU000246_00830 [Jonquetella anthropi E3_33 E1]